MENKGFIIKGNLIDVVNRKIFAASVHIKEGIIERIQEIDGPLSGYLMPGFVDAHVHIESSMVTPLEFSRVAVRHGTIATVSDPHEIANVLGLEGVRFMIDNARHTPMKILFGAPSCVPATPFEQAGATITSQDIKELLDDKSVGFLSEVMNYPGVINGDRDIMDKIRVARQKGVPLDGHAPGVRGRALSRYAEAGITTDHECFSIEEAREKIQAGMKIQIREGSGARNFEALIPLLGEYPDRVMFCTDDLHPDDLLKGHINMLARRAVSMGYDLFDVLRASGYNAAMHYGLALGMLKEGDPADFIVVDSPEEFSVLSTYIDGKKVFDGASVDFETGSHGKLNIFRAKPITAEDIYLSRKGNRLNVIEAIDGELITRKTSVALIDKRKMLTPDPEHDLLKIVVVNRYKHAKPAVGFIRGFGLKEGAIASSIAHDSHNIICVGATDEEIAGAINWIIGERGGIVAFSTERAIGLPLPVAGIMTDGPVLEAARQYSLASSMAKDLGSALQAPFMTLAFMALLVIPELKLSDRGLFDGNTFSFVPLFTDDHE